MGALRFNGTQPELYLGQKKVRGITVDHWLTCIYIQSLNATVSVDWYFTAYNNWTTSLGLSQIPVMCYVSGNVWKGNNKRYIEHYYSFSEFQAGPPDPTKFQTPATIVCPGRISQRPLPKSHTFFTMPSEILMPSLKSIGRANEMFDYTHKLTYYTSEVIQGYQGEGVLDDFNRAISYAVGLVSGSCMTSNISLDTFDSKPGPNGRARIRNSSEFFYFDSGYEYEGIKSFRGVDCHTWINRQKDRDGKDMVFEWYFATQSSFQVDGATLIQMMPLGVYTTSGGRVSIYNIHAFKERLTDIWTFGQLLYRCYDYNHRAEYAFLVPGDYRTVVVGNVESLKYMIVLSVAVVTKISPVRITNLRLDYDENNHVIVAFTLLDKAPSMGNYGLPPEPSLNDAINLLNNRIDSGTFNIDGGAFGSVMTAKRYSVFNPSPSNSNQLPIPQELWPPWAL
ncbi:hypothetical protein ScPMuIL_003036 [Solemya velum]